MKKTLLLAVALLVSAATFAQTTPKDAAKVKKEAHKAEVVARKEAMKARIADHKADGAARKDVIKARIAAHKVEMKAKPRPAGVGVKVRTPKVGG